MATFATNELHAASGVASQVSRASRGKLDDHVAQPLRAEQPQALDERRPFALHELAPQASLELMQKGPQRALLAPLLAPLVSCLAK